MSENINIDPSFHFAYNRIGLAIYRENQRSKVYFEKAVNEKPDYSEGLINYGFILQNLRDYSWHCPVRKSTNDRSRQ